MLEVVLEHIATMKSKANDEPFKPVSETCRVIPKMKIIQNQFTYFIFFFRFNQMSLNLTPKQSVIKIYIHIKKRNNIHAVISQ